MKNSQESVKEFMLKAGQNCPSKPNANQPMNVRFLRHKLIQEELNELAFAMGTMGEEPNIVEIADAIGDLLVVVLGTAVAFGIEVEPVFNEIQRSNMTKFIDGYRREDGKWIKGPSYSAANLKPIIDSQVSSTK